MTIDKDEMFDQLNTALDVLPEEKALIIKEKKEAEVQDDYEFTKTKLKEILEQSEEVLEHAGDIAKETGEPMSIKAFSELAKTMTDVAKAVMQNNSVKASIERQGPQKGPGTAGLIEAATEAGVPITQNNQTIFVGTTKELQDLLEGEAEDAVIIEETSEIDK